MQTSVCAIIFARTVYAAIISCMSVDGDCQRKQQKWRMHPDMIVVFFS